VINQIQEIKWKYKKGAELSCIIWRKSSALCNCEPANKNPRICY